MRGEGTGTLGSLSLPCSELLEAEGLCLDRWFTLTNGQGQVLLRAQLGVSVPGDMGHQGEAGEGLCGQGVLRRLGIKSCVLTARGLENSQPSSSRS